MMMMKEVVEVFVNCEYVLIEVFLGIGKMIGYLILVVLFVKKLKKLVIISMYLMFLQQQILIKDLLIV